MNRCIFRYEIDEIGKNQDKSIKNECVIDFYRLIDTIDINQITFTDFYRFIDWQINIDFYRFTTPGYIWFSGYGGLKQGWDARRLA